MKEIKIFAPATIANISCGFDVLGCCLDTIGDEMIIRKTPEKRVKITKIIGMDLPYETNNNVAGVAALALLADLKFNIDFGFEIEIYKNIKPGSGIGSSAASAAGAVFAINELLGKPFSKLQLVEFARKGEELACGSPIADNVAPALFGGFTLVNSTDPLSILQLPILKDLYATIIHPQIEIKTSDSRAVLPNKILLKDGVKQWANVGAFVHALHTKDYDLLSDSLTDYVVEPHRSKLIPEFVNIKKTALKEGALGCGISGSGPSIFAFSKGIQIANNVSDKLSYIYHNTHIESHHYVSKINTEGIKILSIK
ncbi:MAG: homoserine kinase [Flavobacteriaceae bacterium]|nr:homoserine kinase [Flavobacteriaceae bacterium]